MMAVTKIPKKTVTLIEPKRSFIVDKAQHRQKRVAAYCRVSTDSEEQLTSYTNQMKVYAENHEDDFKNISTQIEQLTKRITAIRESESENGDFQARLKEIQDIIDKRRENKDIYDDSIVRQMVECIKVYHDGRLQIILGGGYELEEYLEK